MSQIFSVSHLNKGQELLKKWKVIFRVTMGTFAFHIKQPTAMEFSPVSLFSHRGQRYPFHPLQATLTPPALLSPSSICPSFTFLLSSLPFSSNMGWPLSSLPSSFTCPTMACSPCSPGPLTSLHPHPHLLPLPLTSPAVAWPSPLTHSSKIIIHVNLLHENFMKLSSLFIELFVRWQNFCLFFFLFTHVPFTCTPVHQCALCWTHITSINFCSSNVPRRRIRKMAKKKRKKGVCAL